MIKLGRNTDVFGGSNGAAIILLSQKSQIIFDGFCSIGIDYALRVTGGKLHFGNYSRLGSYVLVSCSTYVRIGANTDVTFGCQILDSNFHYIHYIEKGLTKRHSEQIIIGDSNWIGNHSSIMKGSKTAANTIVSLNSLLNKDYSKLYNQENILLAGSPAQKVMDNCKRIFSYKKEAEVNIFFKKNPKIHTYDVKSEYRDKINDMISFFE
ncbi:acyltransferase [Maribellus maritimus]|uniref:acyltransferase n=1 Tax=Maribellus maritimus TaxID=2870838 RepID=UPI001EEBCCD3|nr:hypothetical protein [Maribellus maritimus]MCG6188446.1 hypothetical protein [Maribellus maritimus]